MVSLGSEPADVDACPLLGLVTDRRSHFTFPHARHRCYASGKPASVDAAWQTKYCLGPEYTACKKYAAWLSKHRPEPVRMATPIAAAAAVSDPPPPERLAPAPVAASVAPASPSVAEPPAAPPSPEWPDPALAAPATPWAPAPIEPTPSDVAPSSRRVFPPLATPIKRKVIKDPPPEEAPAEAAAAEAAPLQEAHPEAAQLEDVPTPEAAPAPEAAPTPEPAPAPEAAPAPPPPVAAPPPPGIHVFQTGESLVTIATRYGLTLDELVAVNDLPLTVPVADGTRLVVTLTPQPAQKKGSRSKKSKS